MEHTYELYLSDEDGINTIEVPLVIKFDTEATEYENGYKFFQGGHILNDVLFDQDFSYMGKTYKKGQVFDYELLVYADHPGADDAREGNFKVAEKKFNQLLLEVVYDNYEISTKNYYIKY